MGCAGAYAPRAPHFRHPFKYSEVSLIKKFKQGMKIRRAVLGDEHVDRAESQKTSFDADFQRYVTETAWGGIWARPGLDRKLRHMLTLAVLAALGKEQELALHVRATRNTGVTHEELREVFMQVAVYAGVPAANTAFSIAKKVFAEMSGKEVADE